MHHKYGKDGFVILSVSIDDPEDEAARKALPKILADNHVDFRNFLLDDKPEVWPDKLKVNGPPCLYLFNKDNFWVKKLEAEPENFKDLEAEIGKLLKQ